MDESMGTALTLLAVGMTTVFVVLLQVVIVGNLLIRYVNKYAVVTILPARETIKKSKIAAISAAVDIFTKGEGRITNIERK